MHTTFSYQQYAYTIKNYTIIITTLKRTLTSSISIIPSARASANGTNTAIFLSKDLQISVIIIHMTKDAIEAGRKTNIATSTPPTELTQNKIAA
jgi:hypothetical protein